MENSIADPHPSPLPAGEGIGKGFTRKTQILISTTALFFGLVLYVHFVSISLIHALDVPPLRGRVNDIAGIIPPERARALEERLANFERETGHQLAVLTIPTLGGDSLEDFSIRVAENWKIGQKGFDNGAILVVARDDRKLRIEVGYGLEGVLPDAIASRIIREVIVPRFRAGDYAGGIEAGTDAIMKVSRGEKISDAVQKPARQNQTSGVITALFIAALFALVVGISQRTVPRGAFGGATAAGISTAVAASGAGSGLWIVGIILGAILGAVSNLYARQSSNRAWTGRRSRSYDHWRSGGWGPTFGGGFGGGGFGGGFSGGGGSFGGGGASGSW